MNDYDIDNVPGIDKLRARMAKAGDDVKEWSFILSDYITSGNQKISKSTAIFNMNSATDCPNIDTPACQVPKSKCYAHKAENMYPQALPYRRRQEYLWDCMTPELWAESFMSMNARKRKPFDSIRFSEAGDFRSDSDIIRVNRIAELVDIPVYTYSASHYLNWDLATNFTVNASNELSDYGDNRFKAVFDGNLPDEYVWCPNDLDKQRGKSAEERIKCGECRLCIIPNGPNVAINAH